MTAILGALTRAISPYVLTARTVEAIGAGSQTAGYQVDSDGTIKDGDGNVLETWNNTGAAGSDLEVRFVTGSGTTPTGATMDTWLGLGSDRSLEVTDASSGGGAVSGTFTVEIGYAGTSTAIVSTGVGLYAERTS
jgi:hypothetical protein